MNPDTTPAPLTALTPGRRALLITLFAFVLPLLVGGGLFWSGWRPAKTANHGELVQPPKPVPVFTLGIAASGKWLLLLAGDAACDAACIAQINTLRAIQVSLGRDIERIRRVVLIGAPSPQDSPAISSGLQELARRQPDLIVARPNAEWSAALAAGAQHRVFLVDPAGYLMMQYAPDTEPKFIRADLERLLKYSWIG